MLKDQESLISDAKILTGWQCPLYFELEHSMDLLHVANPASDISFAHALQSQCNQVITTILILVKYFEEDSAFLSRTKLIIMKCILLTPALRFSQESPCNRSSSNDECFASFLPLFATQFTHDTDTLSTPGILVTSLASRNEPGSAALR